MTGKTDILTLRQKALLSALTDVLEQANVTNKDGIQNMSALIQKQFDHPTFFDKSAEQAAITQAGAFKDSNGGISAFEQRAAALVGAIMDTTLMRSLKEKGLLPDIALEMNSADCTGPVPILTKKTTGMSFGCHRAVLTDIVGALAAKQAGYDLAVSEKYYQGKSQTLGKADLATHHPAAKTRAQVLSLVNKHATRGLKNILRTAQRATAEQTQANRTPILTTRAALRKSASAGR